jgi:transcriptional regulator with XRE-family HTH domain
MLGRSQGPPDDVYGHIGRAIARARRDSGLSQTELATAIGLSRTSISNIEKGRQKMLAHTLVDIAEALSVAIGSLLPDAQLLRAQLGVTFTGSAVSPAERATISAIVGENRTSRRKRK